MKYVAKKFIKITNPMKYIIENDFKKIVTKEELNEEIKIS